MVKHLNNAVIFMLCLVIGILCLVVFVMVLKFATQEGERKRDRRENEKAALVLREEREKLEKLLKTVKPTEKGEE